MGRLSSPRRIFPRIHWKARPNMKAKRRTSSIKKIQAWVRPSLKVFHWHGRRKAVFLIVLAAGLIWGGVSLCSYVIGLGKSGEVGGALTAEVRRNQLQV